MHAGHKASRGRNDGDNGLRGAVRDLTPIDFAKVAEAMVLRAFKVDNGGDCGAVLDAAT